MIFMQRGESVYSRLPLVRASVAECSAEDNLHAARRRSDRLFLCMNINDEIRLDGLLSREFLVMKHNDTRCVAEDIARETIISRKQAPSSLFKNLAKFPADIRPIVRPTMRRTSPCKTKPITRRLPLSSPHPPQTRKETPSPRPPGSSTPPHAQQSINQHPASERRE